MAEHTDTPVTSFKDTLTKNGFTPDPKSYTTEPASTEQKVVTDPKAEGKEVVADPTPIDWEAKSKELLEEIEKLKTQEPKIITKVLSPEEIQAQVEAEDSELLHYVLDKKLSATEWERFQKHIDIKDRDYVFDKYKSDVKAENPELTDTEIEVDFDNEYGLNTQNEKALIRANNRLQREAKILKDEEFKPFHNIKEEFKTVKSNKARVSSFETALNETLPQVTVSVKIDDLDTDIETPVDYADIIEDVKKDLKNPALIFEFTKEGVDTKKAIAEFITTEVKRRKEGDIIKALVDKAYIAKMKQIKVGSLAPPETGTGSKQETIVSDAQFGFIAKYKAESDKKTA